MFPESFDLVQDPGLVPCAFAGQKAMNENAGSAAAIVTGAGNVRVQPWVLDGICGRWRYGWHGRSAALGHAQSVPSAHFGALPAFPSEDSV